MTHTCVLSVYYLCVCVSDNDGEENYTDYMEKRAFFCYSNILLPILGMYLPF